MVSAVRMCMRVCWKEMGISSSAKFSNKFYVNGLKFYCKMDDSYTYIYTYKLHIAQFNIIMLLVSNKLHDQEMVWVWSHQFNSVQAQNIDGHYEILTTKKNNNQHPHRSPSQRCRRTLIFKRYIHIYSERKRGREEGREWERDQAHSYT